MKELDYLVNYELFKFYTKNKLALYFISNQSEKVITYPQLISLELAS